jgi:hypothetical protein
VINLERVSLEQKVDLVMPRITLSPSRKLVRLDYIHCKRCRIPKLRFNCEAHPGHSFHLSPSVSALWDTQGKRS